MKLKGLFFLPLILGAFIFVAKPEWVPAGIGFEPPSFKMSIQQEIPSEVTLEFLHQGARPIPQATVKLIDGHGVTILEEKAEVLLPEGKLNLKIHLSDLTFEPFQIEASAAAHKKMIWKLTGFKDAYFSQAEPAPKNQKAVIVEPPPTPSESTSPAPILESSQAETAQAPHEEPPAVEAPSQKKGIKSWEPEILETTWNFLKLRGKRGSIVSTFKANGLLDDDDMLRTWAANEDASLKIFNNSTTERKNSEEYQWENKILAPLEGSRVEKIEGSRPSEKPKLLSLGEFRMNYWNELAEMQRVWKEHEPILSQSFSSLERARLDLAEIYVNELRELKSSLKPGEPEVQSLANEMEAITKGYLPPFSPLASQPWRKARAELELRLGAALTTNAEALAAFNAYTTAVDAVASDSGKNDWALRPARNWDSRLATYWKTAVVISYQKQMVGTLENSLWEIGWVYLRFLPNEVVALGLSEETQTPAPWLKWSVTVDGAVFLQRLSSQALMRIYFDEEFHSCEPNFPQKVSYAKGRQLNSSMTRAQAGSAIKESAPLATSESKEPKSAQKSPLDRIRITANPSAINFRTYYQQVLELTTSSQVTSDEVVDKLVEAGHGGLPILMEMSLSEIKSNYLNPAIDRLVVESDYPDIIKVLPKNPQLLSTALRFATPKHLHSLVLAEFEKKNFNITSDWINPALDEDSDSAAPVIARFLFECSRPERFLIRLLEMPAKVSGPTFLALWKMPNSKSWNNLDNTYLALGAARMGEKEALQKIIDTLRAQRGSVSSEDRTRIARHFLLMVDQAGDLERGLSWTRDHYFELQWSPEKQKFMVPLRN